MQQSKLDVVGIGNAIVDVLAQVDESFLAEHELVKGSMTLIDESRAESFYPKLRDTIECSGGSAANTMAGLASLGARCAYIGKVREDALGRVFGEGMRAAGVEYATPPAGSGPSTARCLVLVTPDAQRTMQTYLGISAELEPGDIDRETVESAGVTYLEGYLWDPPPAKQAFLEAARMAHAAGRKVALSLSDSFCVDRHRAEFQQFVAAHVDIVFGNESEIVSLYETDGFDQAVQAVRGHCEIAALTRGERGSVVVSGSELWEVVAEPVERVVDTTGAGDLYASGFLAGLARECGLATCARLGGIAAAEVIGHFGARPEVSLEELARVRLG